MVGFAGCCLCLCCLLHQTTPRRSLHGLVRSFAPSREVGNIGLAGLLLEASIFALCPFNLTPFALRNTLEPAGPSSIGLRPGERASIVPATAASQAARRPPWWLRPRARRAPTAPPAPRKDVSGRCKGQRTPILVGVTKTSQCKDSPSLCLPLAWPIGAICRWVGWRNASKAYQIQVDMHLSQCPPCKCPCAQRHALTVETWRP